LSSNTLAAKLVMWLCQIPITRRLSSSTDTLSISTILGEICCVKCKMSDSSSAWRHIISSLFSKLYCRINSLMMSTPSFDRRLKPTHIMCRCICELYIYIYIYVRYLVILLIHVYLRWSSKYSTSGFSSDGFNVPLILFIGPLNTKTRTMF